MQSLDFYLNDSVRDFGLDEFKRYYYNRQHLSLKQKKDLIDLFYLNSEYLVLIIIHQLYTLQDERDYIIKLLFNMSKNGNEFLPIIKKGLLSIEERVQAIELIKNGEFLVQEWFINTDYYNATEEDKQYILSVTPDMRSHHDCYMLLMYSRFIGEKMREKAFQSVLDRGIIYYLQTILTAPHVLNPAWVPTEEQKEIVQNRINELKEGSKLYALKQIVVGSKEVRQKYRNLINDNDNMYKSLYCVKVGNRKLCFPSMWIFNSGTGKYVDVIVKDNRIIEVIEVIQ